MNYFTEEILLTPVLDEFDCHTKMCYIGNEFLRIVKFSKHDNTIQIDSMYRIFKEIDGSVLEGEELFDPEIYYMLP